MLYQYGLEGFVIYGVLVFVVLPRRSARGSFQARGVEIESNQYDSDFRPPYLLATAMLQQSSEEACRL